MKCDIIIPVWGQLFFTKECIERIKKNTAYPYRLILIDNASDDATRRYLEAVESDKGLDVELIRNKENAGFVKAVNQGLKRSNAPYVCILNNDTLPAPGWLERMIGFAAAHNDIGLINPQCDGHLDTPIDAYAERLQANKGAYMEMNQCQGFCMLVKREVIEKIGHLDESFGVGGFDDTDYSMRAHRAGYRSVAVSDAYVYHRLHASFDAAGNREEWVRRNQKIYYDKWGKHLRIGVVSHLASIDNSAIDHVLKFAYGLAREWSWVHIWLNFRGGDGAMKKAVAECLKKNALPPHQNIRIDHFRLPKPLFNAVILGKLLGRMRKRMRDKRFDALVICPEEKFLLPHGASLTLSSVRLPPAGGSRDWEESGRECARSVKAAKGTR